MEQSGEPEVSLHSHGQLIYDKGGGIIQQGKGLFKKWYWAKWTATRKRMKSDHFFIPCTKTDQRSKCRTWNSWKETGGSFFGTDLSSVFFGCVSSGKGNKSERKQTDRAVLRGSHVGGDHQQNQETTTEREKAFVNSISKKGLIQNIGQIHITQYQPPNTPIKKRAEGVK